MRLLWILILCLHTDGGQSDKLLSSAKILYLSAVDGNSAAAQQADTLFSQLAQENPDNPVYLAYRGSLDVLESGRTLALWKKARLARNGLKDLDAAVSRAPDNLEVRFLRAVSTVHLPGLFQREKECAADFAWLAPQVESAAASGEFDSRYAASSLYYHGMFLDRQGRRPAAMEAWKRAMSIAPESRGGAQARRHLNGR